MDILCALFFGIMMSVIVGLQIPEDTGIWVALLNGAGATGFMLFFLTALRSMIKKT